MYLSITMMDNILSLTTHLTWEVNIRPKIKQPLSYNIYIYIYNYKYLHCYKAKEKVDLYLCRVI